VQECRLLGARLLLTEIWLLSKKRWKFKLGRFKDNRDDLAISYRRESLLVVSHPTDELKGLRNTPNDIKTAVEWFNALLTYFRQRNLSTPRQQKNLTSEMRSKAGSATGVAGR
jgi:hypothetical protein